jgi:hypothetical protein
MKLSTWVEYFLWDRRQWVFFVAAILLNDNPHRKQGVHFMKPKFFQGTFFSEIFFFNFITFGPKIIPKLGFWYENMYTIWQPRNRPQRFLLCVRQPRRCWRIFDAFVCRSLCDADAGACEDDAATASRRKEAHSGRAGTDSTNIRFRQKLLTSFIPNF